MQHKNKVVGGFTKKYRVDKLGYYEVCNDINLAIAMEKQLNGGSRKAKLELIEINNPAWQDLYFDITGLNGYSFNQLDCFDTQCPRILCQIAFILQILIFRLLQLSTCR